VPTNVPLTKGEVTATPKAVKVPIGKTTTVQATPTKFVEGQVLEYKVVTANAEVATAVVDETGKVTITGVAAGTTKITLTVDYKNKTTATTPSATAAPEATPAPATAATTEIEVTVANKTIVLDKPAMTVFMTVPNIVRAEVANASNEKTPVTAYCSDTNIATVSVDQKAVIVVAVQPGTCIVTVKFAENGEEVVATCAVTVKPHPSTDTVTPLKDKDGNPLYVLLENGTYRAATSADYFTFERFYVKGDPKYSGWQTLDGKVYYFTADGKKITGEQVIQGAKYNFASDGSLITGVGKIGIDVSKWNGTIDWNAVKNSGVEYAIIRCGYRGSSEGSLIVDPKFTANIEGALAAGVKVGVYFFTQALDEREAVEEASMVLDLIKKYKITYPIYLDVEASGGRADGLTKEQRTEVCVTFCKTIQKAGYTTGIYANKNWFENKIDVSALTGYKIWLAQYAATPTYQGKYDMWQYRSTGSVTGIKGNVDMNISYLGY
jgi:GH25 family lysozyme M1 (1,4-beta-N-acetylmuramidase)